MAVLSKIAREDLYVSGRRFRLRYIPHGPQWRLTWRGGPYISSPLKEHIAPSMQEACDFVRSYHSMVLDGREASNG